MIRLAILGTRGIPARYGGFETFAEEIAERLQQKGLEVTVYCEKGCNNPVIEIYKGVRLVYVPSPKLGPFSTILFDLFCLIVARNRHDVIYMLGYGSSLFCFIPRLWGKQVWLNMDGIEWKRTKWSFPARLWLRTMEWIAMLTPNRLIADAYAIQDHIKKHYPYSPPISVIPYGAPEVLQADSSPLAEWDLATDRYYLLVCRLEPENHVLEILQGYTASNSNLPLVVLGNHRTGTHYVKQLLAITDARIRMLGTVYDSAKLQALRFYARAYFHGHSVGGTNPSLLEALGCGNAVIAHNNVFNREVADNAALYFSTATEIPNLVEKIDTDETLRAAMRLNARNIVSQRYTWKLVTDAYMALLTAPSSTEW
ncbi:MAG TPA: DUF1972 domain-containing protein [Nitrosomonas sp.]|nr:DUF1972 domain-containing protein [Nitrosomonas sp.]HMW20486.1 DUF1972 domain-containing protein [Nitrosomonas sp.]HMW67807.1 DUF1972 domain-containing protein [Nitrosomonas sp.]HMY89132.1 DUF1972 domain-containing protein [Nitrosomonas sp.]HNA69422.1 DUF1972 domain-containing protein [Nitrosomonas sp.]